MQPHMILAQAGEIPFGWIVEISKWGGGWLVSCLLAFIIWKMDSRAYKTAEAHAKALDDCSEKRIADWHDIATPIQNATLAINSFTESAAPRTAAISSLTEAIKLHTASVERVITAADTAAQSHRELREAVIRLITILSRDAGGNAGL